MRAVVAPEPGGPEVLQLVDREPPRPGSDELLVRVRAAGVNRADLLQRQGRYPPPAGSTDILGLEMAGVVESVGDAVQGWTRGDRACAVLPGGGYAEWATVPAGCALPVPDGLSWAEAGGMPEVFSTAHDNLFTRARLREGETVLIHGISSGVGTAATQLAVRAGCRVIGTASSTAKLVAAARLGASAGINYREEDFSERVHDLTDGRGADVVLDIVGGPYLERNLRALASEGRLVIIGLQGGAQASVDLRQLMARRLTVLGSTLRSRSTAEKSLVADAMRRAVLPGFTDGSLHVIVDQTVPLEQAHEAHRALERGDHIGKLVLTVA